MPTEAEKLAETTRLQNVEWEAWQEIMAEWKKLFPDLDINNERYNPLINSIKDWSDTYAALRFPVLVEEKRINDERVAEATKRRSDPGTSSLGSLLP
jgi:hypothetical protein